MFLSTQLGEVSDYTANIMNITFNDKKLFALVLIFQGS